MIPSFCRRDRPGSAAPQRATGTFPRGQLAHGDLLGVAVIGDFPVGDHGPDAILPTAGNTGNVGSAARRLSAAGKNIGEAAFQARHDLV
jgi:hypothetical protein